MKTAYMIGIGVVILGGGYLAYHMYSKPKTTAPVAPPPVGAAMPGKPVNPIQPQSTGVVNQVVSIAGQGIDFASKHAEQLKELGESFFGSN